VFRLGRAGAAVMAALFAALTSTPAQATVPVPVLGTPGAFYRGSGVPHPELVDAAGVMSSVIDHITWSRWGGPTSAGTGWKYQHRLGGGYYRREVHVQLRAENLGRCRPRGRLTYRLLRVRVQIRPDGPYAAWSDYGGTTLC
jgi:hypothetical protein